MKRTIVGIDPGTTTAIAVIDLQGNILKVVSFRVHDPAKIISKIIAVGKPIVVSCDKRSPPEAVAWFSRKLGARLVSPPEDMRFEEKKALVKEKTGNVHEFDALSAAHFGEGVYRRLFLKIDRVLETREKDYLSEEMKEFLLKNGEMNIDEAIRILEPKEKIIVLKKKRDKKGDGFLSLRQELSLQAERIRLLNRENQELKTRLEMQIVPKRKGHDELLSEKEDRIVMLSRKIALLEKEVGEKRGEIVKWHAFVEDIGTDWVVVQKVKDLSFDSLKGVLNREILFVDMPEVVNEQAEEKASLRIIITNRVPRTQKRFVYVNAGALSLREKGDVVLVKRDELEREMNGKDLLSKVVREYHAGRTK